MELPKTPQETIEHLKKLTPEKIEKIEASFDKWYKKENLGYGVETEFIYMIKNPKVKQSKLNHQTIQFGNTGFYYLQHVYDTDLPTLLPAICFMYDVFHQMEDSEDNLQNMVLVGRTKYRFNEIEKIGNKLAALIGAEETFWNCDFFCKILFKTILFHVFDKTIMETLSDYEPGFLFKQAFSRRDSYVHRDSIAQFETDFKTIIKYHAAKKKKEQKCNIM